MTAWGDGSPLETLASWDSSQRKHQGPSDRGRLAFDGPVLGEGRSHLGGKRQFEKPWDFRMLTLGVYVLTFLKENKKEEKELIYFSASAVQVSSSFT